MVIHLLPSVICFLSNSSIPPIIIFLFLFFFARTLSLLWNLFIPFSFFNFWTFYPFLLFPSPFCPALSLEGRGILVTNEWIPEVRFLICCVLNYKLSFPKLAYKVHENRRLMRKDCLAWFWVFSPFHLAKHMIWIEYFGNLNHGCCQKQETQRHTKLKQNENKLAKYFEAKNNFVCRVQVLRKGSGSGAGKYLFRSGLNLSIDAVFWIFYDLDLVFYMDLKERRPVFIP